MKKICITLLILNLLYSCKDKTIEGNWCFIEKDYYWEWYFYDSRFIWFQDAIGDFSIEYKYKVIGDSLLIFNPNSSDKILRAAYEIKLINKKKMILIPAHSMEELYLTNINISKNDVKRIFDGTINMDSFWEGIAKRRSQYKNSIN